MTRTLKLEKWDTENEMPTHCALSHVYPKTHIYVQTVKQMLYSVFDISEIKCVLIPRLYVYVAGNLSNKSNEGNRSYKMH